MPFDPKERRLAFRALNEAEERAARFYCIPPYRRSQIHYDMLTQQDGGWRPPPPSALAETLALQLGAPSSALGGRTEFYRILLNDESILAAVRREGVGLYPFFNYILTHEMVHLIRLSTILERDAPTGPARGREEERVHHICRQILSTAGNPELEGISDRFSARGRLPAAAVPAGSEANPLHA